MNKIIIVDFQSVGNFHEIINSSILKICTQIYDNVIYKAGKSAKNNMSLYIKNEKSVKLKPYWVFEQHTKLGFFLRILFGFFITIFEYIKLKDNDCLLFLYTNALSMPIILSLNIILKKKIIFIMHGELELQYQKKIQIYKPTKYFKFCHNISFKYLVDKTPAVILVLGDSIKDNLIKIYPNLNKNIISICHPYKIDKTHAKNSKTKLKTPLVIGTIGLMNKEKGLEDLIELSHFFDKEIRNKRLNIKCIGKVIESNLKSDTIEWVGYNKALSRIEFEKQITQLDFILYLYPKKSYKLTASGAIMDAVKLHKPIISIKNDYFEYLMKENVIGYMVKDINEIKETIERILENSEIPNFENEFKSLELKISIPYNTDILRNNLLKIKYIN